MSDLISQFVTDDRALSVSRACRTLSLPRSTWYRLRNCPEPLDPDTELRDRIQHIALARPTYGYRRITRQLGREGVLANHKRVLRLMREDNLLCLRRKSFLATTDSEHALPVYPNLAAELVPNAPDQLWVSDITYIRLSHDFVYLAVILDAFSRRTIGWELDRRIDAALVLAALEKALCGRKVRFGLIHHSDRGVQYASSVYVERLAEHGIQISMSRRGNPYDNAFAESFMKTLKYEEVYLTEYEDLPDARARIADFVNDYNHHRLHSALGYRPPAEFEGLAEYNALGTREDGVGRFPRSASSLSMERAVDDDAREITTPSRHTCTIR
jgi:transposase InsO family protein